ncbi:MAG: hypothetical protein A2882_13450 [Phenylobacterium sp. RIFCSPHIGHO2_01_FULL_70_10]|nr:MAG: hypothetical protein A2882_13450 [Phenylobacterium sp. RIFCSPHIGHO2_01_FULL_70_10]
MIEPRLKPTLPVLLALTVASPVLAAPPAPPRPPLDGPATPEACARLGFPAYGEDGGYRARFAPAPAMTSPLPTTPGPAPTPPPPPPKLQPRPPIGTPSIPPLPVPPVERRVAQPSAPQSMIVTGSARGQPRMDTERYPDATPNPVKRTAEDPVSTFSIDVDTASYANVRRFLNEGEQPPTDAVRVEELINYFDYGYAPPPNRQPPFATTVAVVPSPWSQQRRLVHIGIQGYELPPRERPPLNLVFLIDTSGSMGGPDRLPLAKKAIDLLIDQLGAQDRVAIVAYAGSAGAVLAPTDGRQKLMMRCAVGSLRAGGSTAGGEALALAYDLAKQSFDPKAVNRVVLLTDGDFNVGIADPARLKDFVAERRKDGVYLSVYGFGRGNYNDVMMQALAQNGNGTAAYIDGLTEARRLFREDLPKSFLPIADDVKIQVEFNPAAVVEYRLIGYETRLLNREDFNNDRVDAGEVGSGASVTALYEITPVGARPSTDPLRYQAPAHAGGPADELAFLKIRYKPPGEDRSRLISRPITARDRVGDLAQAPEATRWAVAVAGFAQILRQDPWVAADFGLDDVEALVQGARGADPDGERAEFLTLVRAAEDARHAASAR